MNKKLPGVLRSLFKLTAHSDKIPTDRSLDADIERVSWILQSQWPVIKRIIYKKIRFFFRYRYGIIIKSAIIMAAVWGLCNFMWAKVMEPAIVNYQRIHVTEEIYVSSLKSYDEFIDTVGSIESRNNWHVVSDGGMLGRFQFSPTTLKAIGIDVDIDYFLNDTLLQLAAFKRLLYLNSIKYQNYINTWSGKSLPQDPRYIITESGILMAFHLKPSAAIQYFNSNCQDDSDTDGNGVPVSRYIKLFSGYKLN